MPPKPPFHPSEQRPRHPAEIPLFDILILNVVRYAIRKNVLGPDVRNSEAVPLQQPAPFAPRVGISHRASRLRFGVFRHQVLQFPELAFALRRQYPRDFPRPSMINHDLDRCSRAAVLPKLLQHRVRIRRVMNYPEGVNQIVPLWVNESAQLFGIARAESDALFHSEHRGTLAGQLHRLLGKVHGRDLRSRPRKIDRVRPDAAPDLEYFLSAPPLEIRESRNVIFHEIFPRFHLVEVFLRPHRRGRMPDVTGTAVPIIPDACNFHIGETHFDSIAEWARIEPRSKRKNTSVTRG